MVTAVNTYMDVCDVIAGRNEGQNHIITILIKNNISL